MFRRRPVIIVAGDTALSSWCATCQAPIRIRIPLHDGSIAGPFLGTIEVCPGCGANHATPNITVTPARRGQLLHPVAAAANAVNRADCEARGLPATECAYGDCRMPGLWDCTYKLRQDEGTITYLFHADSHRQAWLEENGLVTYGG
jgi:hypothetical protein